MKVICNRCGGLIDENKAIKLNKVEYKELFMGFFNCEQSEYNQYTQICNKCYKGRIK